jgi:hypothetical protein
MIIYDYIYIYIYILPDIIIINSFLISFKSCSPLNGSLLLDLLLLLLDPLLLDPTDKAVIG